MKFRFGSFLSGFLAAGVLFSVSALAISGRMTIEVDPINVQVNGEVFHPTDVNGKEVPVFAYQGTTYAPLRALAEAYGLEVGYDKAANMATVSDPEAKPEQPAAPDTTAKADYSDWSAEDEAAYQEFKGMWEILDCGSARESIVSGKRTWFDAMPRTDEKTAQQIIDEVPTEIFDKYNERWMLELKQDFGVILSYVERPTDDKAKVGKEVFYCSIFEDGTIWLGHD